MHVPPRFAGLRTAFERPLVVGAAALLVALSGAATAVVKDSPGPTTSVIDAAADAPDAQTAQRTTDGSVAPHLSPLRRRIVPDVLALSPLRITDEQLAEVKRATGATSAIRVAAGQVALGRGLTTAVAVDPASFRAFTPKGTAESVPLWESVARGEVAVAHTVARALKVELGGLATISPVLQTTQAQPEQLRVGAFATTGLPGVGVVVDEQLARGLGLVEAGGLLLTVPGKDPVMTAETARRVLTAATITPMRVAVSTGGKLTWAPPAIGRITSGFGWRIDPHGEREYHQGVDIGAPFGAPIYAAATGAVLYAGPASGYGNEVVLQHADGVITVYGHMEQILVKGGYVQVGQAIALVGSEGDSTGPHLHFEVHVRDQPIDPLVWLQTHGVRVVR